MLFMSKLLYKTEKLIKSFDFNINIISYKLIKLITNTWVTEKNLY